MKFNITKKRRSLLKTISWRVIATITLFAISYFVTGQVKIAGAIVSTEIVIKTILYYIHERSWAKIKYGKINGDYE